MSRLQNLRPAGPGSNKGWRYDPVMFELYTSRKKCEALCGTFSLCTRIFPPFHSICLAAILSVRTSRYCSFIACCGSFSCFLLCFILCLPGHTYLVYQGKQTLFLTNKMMGFGGTYHVGHGKQAMDDTRTEVSGLRSSTSMDKARAVFDWDLAPVREVNVKCHRLVPTLAC